MHSPWCKITFLRGLKLLQTKERGRKFLGEPILQNVWIIFSPLQYFNFQSFLDPSSSSFIRFQCILHDLPEVFSESLVFYKLKRGESFLQKIWIIWSSYLYFNFKSFMDPNVLSFIRLQCLLHHWGIYFSGFWNFYKLKTGGPNFCGERILQNVWVIWSPLQYFNFKISLDPNSFSIIRFQCIVHDSGVLF